MVEAAGYTAELASPAEADAEVTADEAAVRRLRRRLILALVFFVPLTDLSIVLSLFPWARFPGWQWFLVVLAAPVAIWAAWPFHQAALRQARHFSSSMDTLVSLGILASCGWSVYAMFVLDRSRTGLGGLQSLLHASGGGIYLEVAASVTTFLLAGRLYEARARRTAGQAMRELAAAGAKDVCVLGDDDAEQRIPADLLRVGQRFVVRPGERIAADGEVLSGQSAVDRSMMTGESVPVDAAAGDSVTGGTIALTGRLVVRADKVGKDTQLAHLIAMVEQAQAGKAGIQRLADRICAVFVPTVLACAAFTLAGWLLAGSPAGHAVSAALAVLIIACPCALGPGHPGGPGGGLRPRRPARHLHQGLPGPGVLPRHRHRGPGQDRHGHHRQDDRGRRPDRPRHQPHRPAPLRRLGRAGLRARGGRRRHRPGRGRNGAADVRRGLPGAPRPGRPRRRGRPRGRRRPVPAVRRPRDRGSRGPRRRGAAPRSRRAAPRCWSAGTTR